MGNNPTIWSDGRVARQRSAKPRTAVRIRFRPRRATDIGWSLFCFIRRRGSAPSPDRLWLRVVAASLCKHHRNTPSKPLLRSMAQLNKSSRITHLGKQGCGDRRVLLLDLRSALYGISASSGMVVESYKGRDYLLLSITSPPSFTTFDISLIALPKSLPRPLVAPFRIFMLYAEILLSHQQSLCRKF